MSKKQILVISPTPSHPRNAGNRERIYQLLLHIQKLGHEVHFLYITQEHGDIEAMKTCWGDRFYVFLYDITRTKNRCSPSFSATFAGRIIRKLFFMLNKEYAFPYSIDDWYDYALDEFLRKFLKRIGFDVIIVEYVFFAKALNVFEDNTLKVIDTIDSFSDRHKLYKKYNQKPLWFYTNRRNEKKGLKRADVIIAIQKEDERFFAKLVRQKRIVTTISHSVQLCRLPQRRANKNKLLFLASGNPINVWGLNSFTKNVLPMIKSRINNVTLLIAGSICREIDESEDYIKIGEVHETKSVYEIADIVISPIPFGTGIKIKNLEALGYAKPLVTTPSGAKGLEDGAGWAFLKASSPDEFANHVTELLSNPDLRNQLSEKAYSYAMRVNEKNLRTLESILNLNNFNTKNIDF